MDLVILPANCLWGGGRVCVGGGGVGVRGRVWVCCFQDVHPYVHLSITFRILLLFFLNNLSDLFIFV